MKWFAIGIIVIFLSLFFLREMSIVATTKETFLAKRANRKDAILASLEQLAMIKDRIVSVINVDLECVDNMQDEIQETRRIDLQKKDIYTCYEQSLFVDILYEDEEILFDDILYDEID